jgi:hypothetical protein
MVVGLVYGENSELSSHYKRITKDYDYPVYAAHEFWHRLTGDDDFYEDLISAIGSVAEETDHSQTLNEIISLLSKEDKIVNISQANTNQT